MQDQQNNRERLLDKLDRKEITIDKMPTIELYFIDEHRPHLISYTVIEATADGHKILAHNASVRMLEIMVAAHPGCVHAVSESEYFQKFASRLMVNKRKP